LIDRELAELPTKPLDIDTNKEARKEWRYMASLIHDMNAQNMVKRYQILSMIDTAKRYCGEKFFHIFQFDFTGRMYPLTAHFHPQGNDIARGLHRFYEGAELKNLSNFSLGVRSGRSFRLQGGGISLIMFAVLMVQIMATNI